MRRATLIVVAVTLALSSAAHAQLAEPSPVPAAPDEALVQLTSERTELMGELDDLRARITAHNQRCSHVATTDAGLTAACQTSRTELERRLGVYKAGLSAYEADPMVVDARNVPSGLPPSIDSQIPHTPVGDRLRKGYEAVQAHDWKVARAWFQDAQNHAPGDAGIARIVDLAKEAEARQDRVGPQGITALNRYMDLELSPAFQPAWNAFVRDYMPRHPELTADTRKMLFDVAPRALTDAEVKARMELLQRTRDHEMDLSAQALPESGAATDLQNAMFVMHGHLGMAIDERIEAMKACQCEPPPLLQRPQDSDLELLFPGVGR